MIDPLDNIPTRPDMAQAKQSFERSNNAKLKQIWALAKRDANRIGRPLAILSLNQYSPLYVVREVPKATRPGELIEIVHPD